MKVIRRILYVIAVLFAVLCLFIVVCAFRPDITDRVEALLYGDKESEVSVGTVSEFDRDTEVLTAVSMPEAETGTDTAAYGEENAAAEGEEWQREDGADETEEALAGNSTDYIAPDQSQIVVPEHVAGRSGYRQVQDDAQQIDDSVAGDLQNSLDAGYTGDGLDFDALYYPYYAMLDEKGKHIYRQIYANANAIYPTFMPVEE
ncbi:MAG: hypothetical protein NC416_09615, partial [Eubacterium sp.]|nr:hypothetical protein [Eubacterium sp.]